VRKTLRRLQLLASASSMASGREADRAWRDASEENAPSLGRRYSRRDQLRPTRKGEEPSGRAAWKTADQIRCPTHEGVLGRETRGAGRRSDTLGKNPAPLAF